MSGRPTETKKMESKNTHWDKKQIWKRCINWLFAGMVVGFLTALVSLFLGDGTQYARFLTYSMTGGIAGYLVFALQTLGQTLSRGAYVVRSTQENDRAKLQIVTTLEAIHPSFSYPEFEKQLVSYLATILICDDLEELSWCHQKVRQKDLQQIRQTEYEGYLRFYGQHIEKESCRLELGVWMNNEYAQGNKTIHRRELLHVTVVCDKGGILFVESFWVD
jgi:hypothetical protein